MQKNTTDYIAKLSWDAVKTHWKEFMLLPLAPLGLVGLFILGASLTNKGSLQDMIAWIQLLYLIVLIFYLVYSAAAAKWCETLFFGGKDLDLKGGMRFGLSRLGGTIGTGLLTMIKIFLWMLLFILPGLYKALIYSQSVQISQLEKISGGDANRLSKKLIKEAGILRTLGNLMAMMVVIELAVMAFYAVGAGAVGIAFSITGGGKENVALIIAGIIIGLAFIVWIAGVIGFATCFKNFQYLIYRDENKVAFQKAIKELKTING